jgi:hypothetical protein
VSFDIENINGVTKWTFADGHMYHFPVAVITTNVSKDSMVVKPKSPAQFETEVEYSELTNNLGAADIEEYVDQLATDGYFNDVIVA